MSHLDRDPWVDVKTYHGLAADHVISALQKEIRRGNSENAALLAYEMILTSSAMEDYLWYRLKVISVERYRLRRAYGAGADPEPV